MRRISVPFLLCSCLLLAQGAAFAKPGTYRVDDSGTVVLDPSLAMQWQPPGRGASSRIVGATSRVRVQLDLSPWVGQQGRIFMTLPRSGGPAVKAQWSSGGLLQAGTLQSGERALVYAGALTSARLSDLLVIRIETDGARLAEPQALNFGFEIEVDQ